MEFQGPCGGFEYEANLLDEITLLVGGAGITPALQLARCHAHNPADNTRLTLLYYSDSLEDILYHSELESLAGGSDHTTEQITLITLTRLNHYSEIFGMSTTFGLFCCPEHARSSRSVIKIEADNSFPERQVELDRGDCSAVCTGL